jgi:hypothetical protein
VVDALIWVSRLVPHDDHLERCQKRLLRQREAGVTLVAPSLLCLKLPARFRGNGDGTLADGREKSTISTGSPAGRNEQTSSSCGAIAARLVV